MERLGARPSAAATQRGANSAQSLQQTVAPSAGPADESLNFRVGATSAGQFAPFAGIKIWVTPEDPQSALSNVAGAAAGSLSERLAADCHDPVMCARDWRAMSARALGSIQTDAAGHAKTPTIAHGRYWLVGHAAYQDKWLFWHQPVDLRPGSNDVTLDETNGSLMQ